MKISLAECSCIKGFLPTVKIYSKNTSLPEKWLKCTFCQKPEPFSLKTKRCSALCCLCRGTKAIPFIWQRNDISWHSLWAKQSTAKQSKAWQSYGLSLPCSLVYASVQGVPVTYVQGQTNGDVSVLPHNDVFSHGSLNRLVGGIGIVTVMTLYVFWHHFSPVMMFFQRKVRWVSTVIIVIGFPTVFFAFLSCNICFCSWLFEQVKCGNKKRQE